jgi:sigma-E factor negative regulatory protein RseB
VYRNRSLESLFLLLLAVAAAPVYAEPAAPAYAEPAARQWLDAMSAALQSLDYKGTFVYLHDGKLEAMRISHRREGGAEQERLVSLTGSAREVIRDNQSVTCIMPDSKSVVVGNSRPRQPFPRVPRDLDSIEKYYRFESVGDDRMAGLLSRVVTIMPRDAYRYGYRFWIAKDSKMLLKSDLTGAQGNPIEQMMFTHMDVGVGVAGADLPVSPEEDPPAWHHQDIRGIAAAEPGEPRWAVLRLPDGFRLTDYQRKRMHPGDEGTEHLVYSDGLATVSVYVEMASADDNNLTGLSSMGAMNAYGVVINGHQVVAVGEVPAVTVEMMARSVDARRDDPHD